MENARWIIFLILIIISETTAMTLIEKSYKNKDNYYIISILLYGFIAFLFYKLIESTNKNGCTINALWNSCTTISLFLISLLYFKNDITKYNLMGISFAILSIYFINLD